MTAGSCSGIADNAFYWPGRQDHLDPAMRDLATGPAAERVVLRAPGGPALDALWLTHPGDGRGTVVYCHGNSRNWTYFLERVAWVWRSGYQLLLFDYRGFGASEGTPDRAGTVADALAAVDFALARDPDRTLLLGHSLGGAVAIPAAAQRPRVKAVVAEATFANYREVAGEVVRPLWPVIQWMVSSRDDPDDSLAGLAPRPLLLIHGKRDPLVPFGIARRMAQTARNVGVPTWLLATGMGHHTAWLRTGTVYEREVLAFWREVLAEDAIDAGYGSAAPGIF